MLLVIQRQVLNMGNEPAHFQIPVFRTTKGKQYNEVDSIHYKAFQSNLFAATLNPESCHRFICFYRVPLNEVVGGYLVFEKSSSIWMRSSKRLSRYLFVLIGK